MKDGWYYIKLKNDMEQGYYVYGFSANMEENLPPTRCICIKDNIWKTYTMADYMIEAEAFAVGDEVEVSDDGINWYKAKYTGFRYKQEYRYLGNRSGSGAYKYCRRVQEPTIEISVKINGKEAKLSDISEETLAKIKQLER